MLKETTGAFDWARTHNWPNFDKFWIKKIIPCHDTLLNLETFETRDTESATLPDVQSTVTENSKVESYEVPIFNSQKLLHSTCMSDLVHMW